MITQAKRPLQTITPLDPTSPHLTAISHHDLLQIFSAHASIHLAIFDRDTCFVYLNNTAFELVARPRNLVLDGVMGQHWRDLGIPALHMEPIEQAIHHVFATGKPFLGKHAYTPTAVEGDPLTLTQSGHRVFRYHLTPLKNSDNHIDRVIATAEDITDSEIAQEQTRAYKASEDRFRAITSALPVLIAHVDSTIRYTYNSPYYAKLVGRPISDITGKYLWEVLGEARYKAVEHYVTGALAGEQQSYRVSVTMPDGSDGFFQTMMIPQTDNHGEINGYYAVTYDVTELTLTQEKTLTQERHMAHMNRLSTVNEMTSNIAHELNQPLTAINNYAAVTGRFINQLRTQFDAEIKDEQTQELFDDISQALGSTQQQIERASKIIQDVRSFVRQQSQDFDEVDLNAIVEEVLQFTQSTLCARQTTVTTELSDTPLLINGKATQLQQILINLILNAVDAMEAIRPPAEREITITSKIGEPDDPQRPKEYEIIVSDNGEPLSQAAVADIFTPFYTTKTDGMGMGLAISTSIAEAHGGRLTARTNSTQGLSVVLTLPAVD